MRLFAGLPLSDDVRSVLRDAVDAAARADDDWGWTRSSSWHVTLAFLGEVAPDHRDDVEAVIGSAVRRRGRAIELTVDDLAVKSRRMVWARIDAAPEGALAGLGEGIQIALEDAGLPVDRKPVAGHVTLARWRGGGRRAPRSAWPELPDVAVSWSPGEVVLWQSHLGDGPARYEALASFPLAD